MSLFMEKPVIKRPANCAMDNMYCNTEVKKRKIVFFSTNIEYNDTDNKFIFMAKAAKKLGHDVVIVTTKCTQDIINRKLKSLEIYQIGSSIPTSLFGSLSLPFYFLRTVYLSLWLIKMKNDLDPTFIVVQKASAIVPFLKKVGKFRIVQLHTFIDDQLMEGNPHQYTATTKNFYYQCMKHADEIIVENKLSRRLFVEIFPEANKIPTVLYPCIRTSAVNKASSVNINKIIRPSSEAIIFVSFGPLRKSSNFELVINAFALLLEEARIKQLRLYKCLFLVISGYYEDSKEYNDYSTELQFAALKLNLGKTKILFLNAMSLNSRKALLYRCEAVLFPMLHSLDGRTIVEAGLMKKPVIAANSGIARELIEDGYNGALLSPEPADFFKCMKSLIYSKHHEEDRSRVIDAHYKRHFSLTRYTSDLQSLIVRNSRHVQDPEKASTSSQTCS